MAYVYRNGQEYLVQYTPDQHNRLKIAKPRKFGKLCNMKRRD